MKDGDGGGPILPSTLLSVFLLNGRPLLSFLIIFDKIKTNYKEVDKG